MEQLLFDREAAVNQATTDGYAPLFIAAQEGHFPVVQLLLEHGVSDEMRSGALETAFSEGHTVVAQLIAESEEARVIARQGDV